MGEIWCRFDMWFFLELYLEGVSCLGFVVSIVGSVHFWQFLNPTVTDLDITERGTCEMGGNRIPN